MIISGLLHVYVPAVEGVDSLKRKVFQLRKNLKISKSSMVYKRFSAAFQRQQIEAVLQIEYDDQEVDIKLLQKEFFDAKATLLMIEGQLKIDPLMTLPHPNLVMDPFLLKMSAEIAPYWEHKVSQNTLTSLSTQFVSSDPAEFLTQGSDLINLTIKGLV